MLAGVSVTLPRTFSWQDVVLGQLQDIARNFGHQAADISDTLPEFSGEPVPTTDDVDATSAFCSWLRRTGIPDSGFDGLTDGRNVRWAVEDSVAAYFQELKDRLSAATANQHLSAVHQWLE
jgi:hypothetical protein